MRNKVLFALSSILLVGCSNDIELSKDAGKDAVSQKPIGFQMVQKNSITRALSEDGTINTMNPVTSTALDVAKHYNFGVFAHKNGGAGDISLIMDDYLVGYGGTNVGYKMDTSNQTTWGAGSNNNTDHNSYWAYEKMGSSDYTYSGSDGYYTSSQTEYMSNQANQYLKYFDETSTSTDFFAYAPYVHATSPNAVTLKRITGESGTDVLTFPEGTIKAGIDDASKYDFMYAGTNVAKANYQSNDVQLKFKRLNAKVNIKFYEVIDGYSVQILNLKNGTYDGITMVPSKKSGGTYTYGTLYKTAGVTKITWNVGNASGNGNLNMAAPTEENNKYTNTEYITFATPTATPIATDVNSATPSTTDYYLVPVDNTTEQTGLTFHVTYKLTAADTNEEIIVHNATVHVPYSATVGVSEQKYCDWKPNNLYTYIFKITKNSTGSTDNNTTIDPASPSVGTQSLYPIVFDGVDVVDWTTNESVHLIN